MRPLLGLALASFAASSPACARDGLVGAWRIDAIGEERPAAKFNMQFGADGRLTGKACNNFGASFHIEGATLAIGEIMATRMACREPLMSQERRLFELLENATRWRQSGKTLSIGTKTGSSLRAHRVD